MTEQPNDNASLALTVVITAALMALAAEGVLLWSGENARGWVTGMVFGVAVTVLATRFIATNRRIYTGERPIAVGAVGAGLLLGFAALAGILPPDQSRAIETPPLPGASPGTEPTTAPGPATPGPATKGKYGITLTGPANGANVHRCEVFSGEAKVPAGQTLMLSVKNVDNKDENSYFAPVFNWEDSAQLANWSGTQFFGSRDDSVGQNYDVSVVLLKTAAVKAMEKADRWYAPALPKGSQVALTIRLHRVPGAGPAICS